jgi:hypothetical protein
MRIYCMRIHVLTPTHMLCVVFRTNIIHCSTQAVFPWHISDSYARVNSTSFVIEAWKPYLQVVRSPTHAYILYADPRSNACTHAMRSLQDLYFRLEYSRVLPLADVCQYGADWTGFWVEEISKINISVLWSQTRAHWLRIHVVLTDAHMLFVVLSTYSIHCNASVFFF